MVKETDESGKTSRIILMELKLTAYLAGLNSVMDRAY